MIYVTFISRDSLKCHPVQSHKNLFYHNYFHIIPFGYFILFTCRFLLSRYMLPSIHNILFKLLRSTRSNKILQVMYLTFMIQFISFRILVSPLKFLNLLQLRIILRIIRLCTGLAIAPRRSGFVSLLVFIQFQLYTSPLSS